jgi:cation:H+ antiporter
LKGSTQLVIGNLIGSNIANMGLILGITGIISVVRINENMIKRDGYLMLASAFLFCVFAFSSQLSRIEASLMILMYVAYMIFLFREKTIFDTDFFEDYVNFFINLEFVKAFRKMKVKRNDKGQNWAYRELLISIGCMILVILSANVMVDKSIWLAKAIGVTEGFIGLTLVALGTSLPELSISIAASRKGQGDIALGNVIGSNIVNIMFIVGVSGLISPISLTGPSTIFAALLMLVMSSLLILFIARKSRLYRWQSSTLLGLYIIFIAANTFMQLS